MRTRNIALYGTAAVLALGIGLTGGAAMAGVPTIFTPAGVTVDGPSAPMPEPSYPENKDGLSFGSVGEAISSDTEPDLILAVATNGREGYVYKKDLDEADGTTAMKDFKSPEDALAWQESRGKEPVVIPVYEEDGVTVVGEFEVGSGSASGE